MITSIDTPEYILVPLTTILLTLSSFIDSFLLAKVQKEKGIAIGFSTGIIFSVIVITLAIYHNSMVFTGIFFSKIFACILAGTLGGILGVNI